GKRVIGIGSPRASLESNFALHELVGAENYYSGIAAAELDNLRLIRDILRNGPLPVPTLREVEQHDAIFVLGEDLTQTAARLALALRQAVKGRATEIAAEAKIPGWHQAAVQNISQGARHPLLIASLTDTSLDDGAEERVT